MIVDIYYKYNKHHKNNKKDHIDLMNGKCVLSIVKDKCIPRVVCIYTAYNSSTLINQLHNSQHDKMLNTMNYTTKCITICLHFYIN